ncbi:MAG: DUF692 domain-containing protein [Acidobacteria bacterium]|nr:DUF692 domain-containing protein [Acidobacteriota bacterium]
MTKPAFLGHGVGLRRPHVERVLSDEPVSVEWFEVISENYMDVGGRPRQTLLSVRERFPVVLHGVSLSIGSTDPLSEDYLTHLAALANEIEPAFLSDHLCFTGVGGHTAHDLLPMPYTEEALDHVVSRVQRVMERLRRPFALENPSSYVSFAVSELREEEFLAEVARRTGCGILLDVNNVYVSSVNHRFDPKAYLAALPQGAIWQLHLAGHSRLEGGGGNPDEPMLLDTHDHEVPEPVWELYEETLRLFGEVSTLVEWDDHIPEWGVLEAQRDEASRRASLRGDAGVAA